MSASVKQVSLIVAIKMQIVDAINGRRAAMMTGWSCKASISLATCSMHGALKQQNVLG